MKYTASKTIEIKITGRGRYFLPDDQTLKGRKIISIIPVPDVFSLTYPSEAEIYDSELKDMFLSLTTDGTYYPILNQSLSYISYTNKQGLYDQYNQSFAIPNCYVDVNIDTTGVLHLLVFFEDATFANSTQSTLSDYDNLEVAPAKGNRVYFPDNRNLAGRRFQNFILTYPETTPLTNNGITSDAARAMYITLAKGSTIILDRIPVVLLAQSNFYKSLEFANIEFDCESSFIECVNTDEVDVSGFLYLITKMERR